jgi:hypothetical protein
MKTLRFYFVTVGLILASLTLNSCLNDDGYSLGDIYKPVIATARPLNSDSFYLRLDDSTTFFPAAPLNIHYQPLKPQRVLLFYTILGEKYHGYDYAIKVNRLDTILTKAIAEDLGAEKNDEVYGKDPVNIVSMWVGDGFLNIEFETYFSSHIKHFVNLIPGVDAKEHPYQLEFRHNAYHDSSTKKGVGVVAFDLSSLPDTEGKEVTLTIKVNTFDGVKEIVKKYNSGTNTEKQPELSVTHFEDTI